VRMIWPDGLGPLKVECRPDQRELQCGAPGLSRAEVVYRMTRPGKNVRAEASCESNGEWEAH